MRRKKINTILVMSTDEGKEKLMLFIQAAKKDSDPYFLVHFSRENDRYEGYHEGMDEFDARIVIKHLMEEFNLLNP